MLRRILGTIALIGALAGGTAWLLRETAADRPATFLIVMDTLRPDRLSCYGSTRGLTPDIDELAARGVLFTNAHAAASWTVPSMGTMLTSVYPTQLGLVEQPASRGTSFEWRTKRDQLGFTPPPQVRTLAEILRDSGLRTAAFVNQPGLNSFDGFLQGFVDWFWPADIHRVKRHDPNIALPEQEWPEYLMYAHRIDNLLIKAFDRWLELTADAGIFVWLHLLTPHEPYLEYPRPAGAPPPPESLSDQYDEEIRVADRMVGDIIRIIEKRVGFDRAKIIFTSDHGEGFGEHGMKEHGHTLHREVTHVPLIVVSSDLPAGRVVETRVPSVDILPTFLDFVGIDLPLPNQLEGTSLLSVIEGNANDRPIYSEGMLYGSTERSLVDDGYKLMFDEQGDRYFLYDLSNDPGETIDLSAMQEDRTNRMKIALNELHSRLKATYLAWQPEGGRDDLSEEDRKVMENSLRALGYSE
jgi:arylsulfatase A-like enzyme